MNLTEGTLADKRTLDLAICEFIVSVEDQLVYAHLILLVDIHVEDNLVSTFLFLLNDVDLGILVTLVIEIFLSQDLGTVNDITRETHAFYHTQLGLHIIALGFLDAMIADVADTGTQTQVDTEVYLITDDRVGCNANLRE